MALVTWRAEYILPEERTLPVHTRSDMRYGATREGVEIVDGQLQAQSMSGEEYLQYMASRRGAAQYEDENGVKASDGLFNASGKADLTAEQERFAAHPDSVEWRAILSFTKDELLESGYFSVPKLQQLLTATMPQIAVLHGISPENLVWNAAFHPVDKLGQEHHPHVHVYFYSTDPAEGQQSREATQKAFEKTRSLLTNTVFHQQMQRLQLMGREARQVLRQSMEAIHQDPDWLTQSGIAVQLQLLHDRLPDKGKQQYGYLPGEIKKLVDSIVRGLVEQPCLQEPFRQLTAAQRAYVEAYNDDPAKIDRRMKEWEKRFFHPTGKTDKADIHNYIVELARNWEEDSRMPSPESKKEWLKNKLITEIEHGQWSALYSLGLLLEKEEPEQAAVLYRAAADRRIIGGMEKTADIARRSGDTDTALRLYRSAAIGNSLHSMYELGKLYETGSGALKADAGMAMMWFDRAAANGHLWATVKMASRYPHEDERRRVSYHKNAILGLENFLETHPDAHWAQCTLGKLYEQEGDLLGAIYAYGCAHKDANGMANLIRLASDPTVRQQITAITDDPAAIAGDRLLRQAQVWQRQTAEAQQALRTALKVHPEELEHLKSTLPPGVPFYRLTDTQQQAVRAVVHRWSKPTFAYMERQLYNTVLSVCDRQTVEQELHGTPAAKARFLQSTVQLRELIQAGETADSPAYLAALQETQRQLAAASPAFAAVQNNRPHITESAVDFYARQAVQQENHHREVIRRAVTFTAESMLSLAGQLMVQAADRQAQQYDYQQAESKKGKLKFRRHPTEKAEKKPENTQAPEQETHQLTV